MSDKATVSALSDFDAAKCAQCGHIRKAHMFGLCDECPDEKCECNFEAIVYAGGAYSPDAERAAYERALRGE